MRSPARPVGSAEGARQATQAEPTTRSGRLPSGRPGNRRIPAVAARTASTPAASVISFSGMTLSLDEGRVSFGDRDEIELATAVDPVCGAELRRADAAAAIDYPGVVYFFCSTGCRDSFLTDPSHYAHHAEEPPAPSTP